MKKQDKFSEKSFLDKYNLETYARPSVAADMAVFTIIDSKADNYRKLSQKQFSVLLIKRGEYPCKNMWALPGGFVRPGETVEQTAYRELQEEAGITNVCLTQLHVFSEPQRDPRGWIISCAFMALADSQRFKLKSSSDAIDVKWFTMKYESITSDTVRNNGRNARKNLYRLSLYNEEDNLSAVIETESSRKQNEAEYRIINTNGIAFDHAKIIAYAISHLRDNLKTSMFAFEFLPEYFTLTELQMICETILDKKLLAANFRRKIADYVTETKKAAEGAGHRPAKLYMRNFNLL